MIDKIIYNKQLLNNLIIFKFLNKNSRCYKKNNSKLNYCVLFLLNLEVRTNRHNNNKSKKIE